MTNSAPLQSLMVIFCLLVAPLPPLLASCCCILMAWSLTMSGLVLVTVNIFRVFLVVQVSRWQVSVVLYFSICFSQSTSTTSTTGEFR